MVSYGHCGAARLVRLRGLILLQRPVVYHVGLHPDAGVAQRRLVVRISFALVVALIRKLFHSLVHGHIVGEDSVADQKLQLMSRSRLRYCHSGQRFVYVGIRVSVVAICGVFISQSSVT